MVRLEDFVAPFFQVKAMGKVTQAAVHDLVAAAALPYTDKRIIQLHVSLHQLGVVNLLKGSGQAPAELQELEVRKASFRVHLNILEKRHALFASAIVPPALKDEGINSYAVLPLPRCIQ